MKGQKLLLTIMLAAMCMFVVGGAFAATFEVAVGGTGDGTASAAGWVDGVVGATTGDTIHIAAGTYNITSQTELITGVTYLGDGAATTIVDGGGASRVFTAWGDRAQNDALPWDDPAIDVDDHPLNASGPTGWVLDGLTFQNGLSDDVEKVVERVGDPAFPTHTSNVITNPDASDSGGAMHLESRSSGTIQNCNFLTNKTPPATADPLVGGEEGGAIYMNNVLSLTIDSCLFEGNVAVAEAVVDPLDTKQGDGGAIATRGGSGDNGTSLWSLLTVTNTTFKDNKCENQGGAIRTGCVGMSLILENCVFDGNSSSNHGAAFGHFNEQNHEGIVTNCLFVNNTTPTAAGGDRLTMNRRNQSFINSTFVSNNVNDNVLIYNNANNTDTSGDGTDDESADATIVTNCLFLNNVVGNGDGIFDARSNDPAVWTVTATNCLFFGNTRQDGSAVDNTTNNVGATGTTDTGSIIEDPLLDANHKPQTGSPAIDAGITAGAPATDLDGNPRDANPDIGAYEFAGGGGDGDGDGDGDGGTGEVDVPDAGMPVASVIGLGLLAGAIALGGTFVVRKKK